MFAAGPAVAAAGGDCYFVWHRHPSGKHLGSPGYSYDFVVRLFAPLIEQWGKLCVVPRDRGQPCRFTGTSPGVRADPSQFPPPSRRPFCERCDERSRACWEYPDIPDHVFDNNRQNNWVETAARCNLLIVGGPFTEEAFRRSDVRTPIRIVPVPTPDDYFHVPSWKSEQPSAVNCSGQMLTSSGLALNGIEDQDGPAMGSDLNWKHKLARCLYRGGSAVYRRRGRGIIETSRLCSAIGPLRPRLGVLAGHAGRTPCRTGTHFAAAAESDRSAPASLIPETIAKTGKTC